MRNLQRTILIVVILELISITVGIVIRAIMGARFVMTIICVIVSILNVLVFLFYIFYVYLRK